MFKKLFFLIIFSLLSTIVFAQRNWIVIETGLQDEYVNLKDALPIVDVETGNIAFFLREKRQITAYLYNGSQELISKIIIDDIPKKSRNIIGHSIKNDNYLLYFKRNSGLKFGYLKIDFKNKTFKLVDDIDISFEKEQFIESFVEKDKFYILTSVNKSSILNLYTLDNEGSITKKEIILPENKIKSDTDLVIDFSSIIFSYRSQIKKLDIGEPLPLENVAAQTKVFCNNGKIVLTNNFFGKRTFLLDINLSDGAVQFNALDNLGFIKGELKSGINSFIFDNHYFNVYATKNKLLFSIYSYPTLEMVKSYKVEKHEIIDFKNTKITQKVGDGKYSVRELQNTSQYLRKIANKNLGISVYKNNNDYVVTLGSSKVATGGTMSIVGGVLGGAVGGVLFSTFDNYNKTKSVQIQCLFDENFNHNSNLIPENGFDKINKFTKDFSHLKAQSVFRYKEDYVWGSFNHKTGLYRLFIFD
ncbi:hypothetical protein [Lacinutrix mariniflava]|uniref:hypothetical protein n=1 Tax=Lacinutrix mariniflava TaxID=342955 RepID=UPI0006E24B17|nr:hypothetical protein [Lacinutrix mariniflava]